MAEPKEPREPRIPKESPPFDADNKWTRTWIMYFESLFRLSVKEAVRQTLEVAVTHTSGDLTKDLPVFGNDKADIKVGTKSGNTTEVATVSGAVVTGNTVKWDANGNLIDAGSAPGGGSGTVTHTGGALTADQPVFGAGSADIKVGTKTGNTNKLVSNTGTNVTGNTVKWDASGNLIDAGSAPGGGGSSGALVLLESHTASSSATLNFTTRNATGQSGATFQSDYDQYRIIFANVIPATNAVAIYVLVSTNGGSTRDTTAIYDREQDYGFGTTTGADALTNQAQWSLAASISNNSNYGISGEWMISSPLSTALYKGLVGQFQNLDASVGNIVNRTSAWYKSTTAINAIQIKFSSGNIASGTIRVYGLAK